MPRKTKKPLKVGFDLDGVLLYNPVRTIRPIVATVKKKVFKKKKTRFYYPDSEWEQKLFRLFHKSSFMTATGFDIIKTLVEQKQIEAYIVTARFDYLKPDVDAWFNKINGSDMFAACYHNERNEQPHYFKERMLHELGLDIYVEDNWDIVKHLNESYIPTKPTAEVLWVTNVIDMMWIDYPYKFISLRDALYHLTREVSQRNS